MEVLTTKELAERWKCDTNTITEMVRTGKLKAIEGAPKYRFGVRYIQEYEDADCNPLSPLERRRLEKEIASLNELVKKKDSILADIRIKLLTDF